VSEAGSARLRVPAPASTASLGVRTLLGPLLLASLLLNLWGNGWGTPKFWHPDELVQAAVGMVQNRTIEPVGYQYGGLPTYTIALLAVGPVGVYSTLFDREPPAAAGAEAERAWKDRQWTAIMILARSVSAFMVTAQVLITYGIGRLLFGARVGVVAAAIVAFTPYFVGIAHFATVDPAANLWSWLAVLCGVLFWRRGSPVWLVLAGLVAGLAIGTKLDRLLVLVPLGICLWAAGADRGALARFPLLVLGGFVIANPWLVVSPFQFADGTLRDLFFNLSREQDGAAFGMLFNVAKGLTWPVAALMLVGLAYSLGRSPGGSRDRLGVAILLAAMLPYLVVFSANVAPAWYAPYLFPGAAILAALTFEPLLSSARPLLRYLGLAVAGATVAFLLLNAVVVSAMLTHESRHMAITWVEAHVPRGAVVEVGRRGPHLDTNAFQVVIREMQPIDYEYAAKWRDNLEDNWLYPRLRSAVLELERRLSASDRKPYQAWFDRNLDREPTPPATAEVVPDYRIFTDRDEIARLEAEHSGYRRVATLRRGSIFGLEFKFPFVNPVVHIYERAA
jgi:hypothetical protein